MEWNCRWSVNTVTPFLFESSGDSEEVKSDVHHHHDQEQVEAVIDESSQGLSFRFDDDVNVEDDDDDDAQSCSYDHSSISTRYGDDHSQHDQPKSKKLRYDDHEDSNIKDDEDDGDIDDNMDSSKRQKRSHNFCVDNLLNQREIDRKFWEACLAS
ncbi:hypothetical protein Hanom_Chr01g00003971 [Helianthus anomalus]